MYKSKEYNCINVMLKDGKKYCLKEHRLNALINNSLKDVLNDDVHHKNGCKIDNRPENLELISHSEHSIHHNPKKDYRIVKAGFNRGKQQYAIDYNGKRIYRSINLDKVKEKLNKIKGD